MSRALLAIASVWLTSSLPAQPTPAPAPPAYLEYQVEHTARLERGAPTPTYPRARRAAGIEGKVIVTFIVDTMGVVEAGSVRAIEATDKEFRDAVLIVVPLLRFDPAFRENRPVRQVVQQTFVFSIPACQVASNRPKGCLPPGG